MNIQRFISTLLTVLSVCLQHQSRTDNSELNVNSIDESQTNKQHVTSNFMIHPVTPNSKYELRLSSDLNLDKYAMLFYHIKHNRMQHLAIPIDLKHNHHRMITVLIISGDIALNPGPPKYPCGECYKPVAKTHRAVLCEGCNYWWHIKCASISPSEYSSLSKTSDAWLCKNCNSFHFTDSFFEQENDTNIELSINIDETNQQSVFEELKDVKKKHPRKFIVAHLNINSMKFKFVEIEELLNEKTVDLLFISETKIDSSFRNSIFEVSGYKLERHDRNIHGGGLAAFIRTDIPARRRHDLECKNLENIIYEVTLNKTKWSILCVYRPPSMSDKKFSEQLTITIDKCITQYDHYLLMGDLNYDLLCKNKGKTLFDLMELFDLCNLIKEPTCFMKNCKNSLLDVILTNSKSLCFKTLNFTTGISDCHNMISTVINNITPANEKQKIKYRSFKNLDVIALNEDLSKVNIQVQSNTSTNDIDVNEIYETFESDINTIFDKHVPIKEMYRKNNQLPYMNRELRKAIYNKKMYYSKFLRQKF